MRNVDSPSYHSTGASASTSAGASAGASTNSSGHNSSNSTPNKGASSVGWGGFLLGLVTNSPDISSSSSSTERGHSSNAATSAVNSSADHYHSDGSGSGSSSGIGDDYNSESNQISSHFMDRGHVVMYYCVCLVGGVPGTLYVTQQLLWLVYGISITGSLKRESLPLSGLDGILPLENANLLQGNTVRFSFFEGIKTFLISPLALDCNLLRTVITSIKDCFVDIPRVLRATSNRRDDQQNASSDGVTETIIHTTENIRSREFESNSALREHSTRQTTPQPANKKNLIDLL